MEKFSSCHKIMAKKDNFSKLCKIICTKINEQQIMTKYIWTGPLVFHCAKVLVQPVMSTANLQKTDNYTTHIQHTICRNVFLCIPHQCVNIHLFTTLLVIYFIHL